MTAASDSLAAAPPEGTATPTQAVEWTGAVLPGTDAAGDSDGCFGTDKKPDPTSGCDFFNLNVEVPENFYEGFLGGVQVTLTGFAPFDIDLGIYRRNPDGTRGDRVGGSGAFPGEDERTTLATATGAYIVAAVPYAVPPGQTYKGKAEFVGQKADPALDVVNRNAPPGQVNVRASRDQYISHSEPSIAMDPLNPDHLIAGSKMYENLPKYLFKAGTYESFDGGRSWEDQGQLPGYCQAPGQCDPSDEAKYRTVSDISVAFDDEGNGYANMLDAPGGTFAFTGFNLTVNIKRPGKPWTNPIIVHDNRNNPIAERLLLDDKNWIAVDNVTDVNGGPNKPGDGKIGTAYVCWSFDGSQAPSQQIVLMKSKDGGKTWGGFAPGDNTPYQLSQKTAISGIGCHILVGPHGEVYVSWYDNQLDAIMQVKSTDRGATFTPARPVVTISGVNAPFEGQSFRNLSIPTTGIDKDGNIYIVAASAEGQGAPVQPGESLEQIIKEGNRRAPTEADEKKGPGADIVLFKSTDGGTTYAGPTRVNQDSKEKRRDQFQPWLAVTPNGQLDVMYFDRRNDPNNFFIDTYLSRSNDGGKTFSDVRVTRNMWDPRINPPISVSGEFIGDYQGVVADDNVAIPFWNDTQSSQLPKSDPDYSPYQEVWSARIGNAKVQGGPAAPAGSCNDTRAPASHFAKGRKSVRLTRRALRVRGTAKDLSNCRQKQAGVRSVIVSLAKRYRGNRCRYLQSSGRLGSLVSCRRPVYLPATGTTLWTGAFKKLRLTRGTYALRIRAIDVSSNIEHKARRRGPLRNFRTIRLR
jgi:hypothetical protein